MDDAQPSTSCAGFARTGGRLDDRPGTALVRPVPLMSYDIGDAVDHIAHMALDPLLGDMRGLADDFGAVDAGLGFEFKAIGKGAVVDAVHRFVPVIVG